ncbi:MAG: tail fiber domain-containing protein, partial [Saprospiraceae bacterium]|nr:tail fiber domain-containing protein [Saprospiraceae bacterium]
ISLEGDGQATQSLDLSSINTDTDDQTIDVLNLNGTTLEISLEGDGQATQTLDISSINSVQTIVADADNDTKIQVEESGDEDKIRFDMAGTEYFRMSAGRLEVLNTGNSVFIGEGAGVNDDLSSNQNTFIGYEAGQFNTTGEGNVFTGFKAGLFNTTGIQNVFSGSYAGNSNTTGGYNVFTGFKAGDSNTTGSQNVFSGFQAGSFNTTGFANVFSGFQAGNSNTTGFNNVISGSYAGYLNTTGNNNVFLGNRAGYNETGSDKLYIDNSDTSTPLIWGDFSTNRAGINRVATTNTLEVGGNASKASAGDWLANSDARLKKNITPLSSEKMLNNLLALQGVTYEWNDDKTGNIRPEGIQYGFTAQNIEAVFPTLVDEDNTGYLQTAYGTYDAMTIEAIRALNDKITAFEKGNIDLSVQVQSLEEENEALKAQAVKINQLETMMAELQSQIQGNTEAYNSEN